MRVGVDLIEIERVRRALDKRPRFAERVFTEAERAYCFSRANPAQHFAARFAGKEAVGKALGCGVEFMWRDIEIVGRPKPSVALSGKVAGYASYGDWRAFDGYRHTVEHSVYVDKDCRGAGIGEKLMRALIERASAANRSSCSRVVITQP